MTEDFPEDSFFRNSNVALLEAAVLEEKREGVHIIEKKKIETQKHFEIYIHSKESTAAPLFITAKQLLIAQGSGSPCEANHTQGFKEQKDKYVPPLSSSRPSKRNEKSFVSDEDSKTNGNIIISQKSETAIKEKAKKPYKPLNITKNVVQPCKQTSTSSINIVTDLKSANLNSSYGYERSEESNSSVLSTQHKLKLDCWGLPESILQQYRRKGITEMFPWQVECLCCPGVLRGGNLVYSAPTSAGKTLVSEILCIKTIVERHKKVLFVLPFVSVVREKMFYFKEIFKGSRVRVDGFMGGHSAPGGFKSLDIAVCTIEKANSIINRLMEENEMVNLGAVVVDELHLIGDPHRGYLLELLLTKLKYMSLRNDNIAVQLIGMSATLPNLSLLSSWLNADLFKTSFRPVPLEEFIKIGNIVYNTDMKAVRTINSQLNIKNDTEDIVYLCVETIAEGHSVLIFCPTKSWCESLAQTIACEFRTIGLGRDINAPDSLAFKLREQLNSNQIAECLEQLRNCPVGLDNSLGRVVSFAVSYHHAGLSMDERDIIEGCFKNGTLRVLVATSTLSSGVNLPARRVIIRSPVFQGRPIDILSYRQMVGRAGRMGVDLAGESILISQKTEQRIVSNLVSSDLKPIQSCLGMGDLSASLKRAILEVIASGVATTPDDLKLYTNCTLLAQSQEESECNNNPVTCCIKYLSDNELIRLQTGDDQVLRYIPTPFGQACLSASLHPDEGLRLFKELQRARQCFVLENELHLIYQVTPFSVADQFGNLDWFQVLSIWEQLSPDMKRVGELVGVEDRFIVRAMRGTINQKLEKQRDKLMIHRRFYTALALHDLVNEIPLNTVALKFNCSRGMLQSLQQSAATYAGMVTIFCRRLGWSTVELIIDQFQDRLHFGTQRELLDLLRLPSLNGPRARSLYNAGITCLSELTSADVLVVENALLASVPFLSDKGRDGETLFESERRRKLKGIWVTGRQGLSEREAAELLISEARSIIQMELGLNDVNWNQANLGSASLTDKTSEETGNNERGFCGTNPTLLRDKSNELVTNPAEHCDNIKKFDTGSNKVEQNVDPELISSEVTYNTDRNESVNKFELCAEEIRDEDTKERKSDELRGVSNVCNTSSGLTHVEDIGVSSQSFSASSLTFSNNVLDHNINVELNLNDSNEITLSGNQPPTSNAQSTAVVRSGGKIRISQENSMEKLFDLSFSKSGFVQLDEKLALETKETAKHLDIHNAVKSPEESQPASCLDSCLESYGISNSALGRFCLQEDLEGEGHKIVENELGDLDTSVQCSSRKRLSSDLFEVSPHQCENKKTVLPEDIPSKDSQDLFSSFVTPTSDRVLRPRLRSGGSSNSKVKQDLQSSPLLVDSSPSLFGDSFEMNTGLMEVLDGDIDTKRRKSVDIEEFVSPIHSEQGSNLAFNLINKESCDVANINTSRAFNRNNHSDLLSACRANGSTVATQKKPDCKVNGSKNKIKYSLRRRSGEDTGGEKENELSRSKQNLKTQRVASLQIGLSRKATMNKNKSMKNNSEILTDSFLEAAFKSALDFEYQSSSCSESVDTKDTVQCTDGAKQSTLRDSRDKFSSKRPKRSESSDDEIVMSSPEECSKKSVRNVRLASISTISKKHPTKPDNVTVYKTHSEIGPPVSKRMLATRQRELNTSSGDLEVHEICNVTHNFSLDTSENLKNPFDANPVVDWSLFSIIDVCCSEKLFKTFSKVLLSSSSWAFSLACERFHGNVSCETIGSKILRTSKSRTQDSKPRDPPQFVSEDVAVVGLSVSFGGSDAYYITLEAESGLCVVNMAERLQLLKEVFSCCEKKKTWTVCCFDIKEQYKMFFRSLSIRICCLSIWDPKVGDWLLEPEGKEKNLHAMVIKYAADAIKLTEHVNHRCTGLGSFALDIDQTVPGRQRSSVEAILCYQIMSNQYEKLKETGLLPSFTSVEMPVVLSVGDMELTGIGFNLQTLQTLQVKLQEEMSVLEAKAYLLAKRSFSLLSPADTARVLYQELKLGNNESLKGRVKNTSKETLERLCSDHPLPGVILLWRKLNAIHSKTVCPLLPDKPCSRLFGRYIMHTSTGRISMYEPNIQCIPRDFESSLESKHMISMRSAFVASADCLLVGADYSQLELRLLAHLSADQKLRDVINCDQDVFCNLASSWNNLPIEQVTEDLRQKAKQMCYGIIYGMGARALANQLKVDESEALTLINTFHDAFPGIQTFLSTTIDRCRELGYVSTLLGRRRYLPGIRSSNIHVKGHAERQAVNTAIQGSAADLTKTAMVNLQKKIHANFPNLITDVKKTLRINTPCLVLHLHDELMYEVPVHCLDQFCKLIRHEMENAILLSIKLPVKVKAGKSWGGLNLIGSENNF